MKRSWQVWLMYGACLAVALSAVLWLTVAAWRLEHAEQAAQHRAKREEQMRLASWRIDSTLMPIIAPEVARSYDDYRPRQGVVGDARPEAGPRASEYVLSYVEVSPTDSVFLRPAISGARLERLSEHLHYDELVARLPKEMLRAEDPASEANLAALGRGVKWMQNSQTPAATNAGLDDEFQRRQEFNVKNTARQYTQQRASKSTSTPDIQEGVSRPIWVGDELLLARRVLFGGRQLVFACWLDWEKLRRDMKAEVADQLSDVELLPVRDETDVNYAHALATLPVQLVAPDTIAGSAGWTPLRVALVVGWAGLLVGAVAAAALLAGVVSLSQRRAAFVSAVTHELRTPLTTFRMYAEMLDSGMVADETQRKDYLGTLRREADRLWHLVENVLAYARLERGRKSAKRERLTVAELWNRVQPRLAERAREGRMELALDMDAGAHSVSLETDAMAVEQILFNLVDNACKYAAGATARTIHVVATAENRHVMFRVRDHGAGIRPADARRLFRPFSKSADAAASSAPGVGLGLALSRQLARQMGGDLRYDATGDVGATFVVVLTRA